MRRRHVSFYCKKEFMDKHQRLHKNNMSVEKYRQKMDLYIMRVEIGEVENTIVREWIES